MVTLLDDVALQHHRLLRQYLEAESASLNHFEQVENVRSKVAAALEQASQVKGETLLFEMSQVAVLYKSSGEFRRKSSVRCRQQDKKV